MNEQYLEFMNRRQWLTTAFAMTAFSGCGGDAPPPSDDPPADSVLFAVDGASGMVMGYPQLSPPINTAFASRQIGMSMLGARRLALDAKRDELYVLLLDRVLVYAKAKSANAAAGPSRTLILPATTADFRDMHLDVLNDCLYVTGRDGDVDIVHEFNKAHKLNGSISGIEYFPENGAVAIAIDGMTSTLYATGVGKGVSRYDDFVGKYSPLLRADAVLGVTPGPSVSVDTRRDILYFTDGFRQLQVFRQISASPQLPEAELSIPGISSVAIDSNLNRLYVGAGSEAFIFDNASGLTSATPIPLPFLVASSDVDICGFAFRSV